MVKEIVTIDKLIKFDFYNSKDAHASIVQYIASLLVVGYLSFSHYLSSSISGSVFPAFFTLFRHSTVKLLPISPTQNIVILVLLKKPCKEVLEE